MNINKNIKMAIALGAGLTGAAKAAVKSFHEYEKALANVAEIMPPEMPRFDDCSYRPNILYGTHVVSIPNNHGILINNVFSDSEMWPKINHKNTLSLKQFIKRGK